MTVRWNSLPAAALLVLLSFSSPATADLLITYDAANSNLPPTILADDISGSSLSVNPNPPQSGNISIFGGGGFNGRIWFLARQWQETNGYYSFTVTPNPGFRFTSVSNLTFVNQTTSGITGFVVRTSADNFLQSLNGTNGNVSGSNASTNTLPLLGTYVSPNPLEVRIYGLLSPGGAMTVPWLIDDIALSGSIQLIPEPSTAALWLIACGALRWVYQRKRTFSGEKRCRNYANSC